jgi:hypothetical protein
MSAFLTTAAIALGIAFLLALGVWLVLRRKQTRRGAAPPVGAAEAVVATTPRPPAATPDDLAARGDLAEALRMLLVHAMRATGWSPEGVGVSRTAREVLGTVATADPRRAPLADIVGIAEHVRFAGAPPTRELYDRARLAWAEIARTPGGGT